MTAKDENLSKIPNCRCHFNLICKWFTFKFISFASADISGVSVSVLVKNCAWKTVGHGFKSAKKCEKREHRKTKDVRALTNRGTTCAIHWRCLIAVVWVGDSTLCTFCSSMNTHRVVGCLSVLGGLVVCGCCLVMLLLSQVGANL